MVRYNKHKYACTNPAAAYAHAWGYSYDVYAMRTSFLFLLAGFAQGLQGNTYPIAPGLPAQGSLGISSLHGSLALPTSLTQHTLGMSSLQGHGTLATLYDASPGQWPLAPMDLSALPGAPAQGAIDHAHTMGGAGFMDEAHEGHGAEGEGEDEGDGGEEAAAARNRRRGPQKKARGQTKTPPGQFDRILKNIVNKQSNGR